MAFAEGRCQRSCVWMLLPLLLVSHATAHPTSTTVPDTTTFSPRAVSCDWETQHCWSQGQLASARHGCAEPFARGACGAGQWWVLDRSAVFQTRPLLRGRCAPRPCPLGQLPSEGRCLAENEARVALCGGRALYLDPAGIPRCGDFPGWTAALAAVARCEEDQHSTTMVAVNGVDCAMNDRGECVNTVEGTTSSVVIMAEDY